MGYLDCLTIGVHATDRGLFFAQCPCGQRTRSIWMGHPASAPLPKTNSTIYKDALTLPSPGAPFTWEISLSGRGQGHASCGRRPRIASLPILPTLKGANGSAPPGPRGFHKHRYRRFHPRLLIVFPWRGTWQRSNLFESHGSNQWLTFVPVM